MVFAFLGSLNKGFCCLIGCYEPVFLACYAVIRIDKHGFGVGLLSSSSSSWVMLVLV